MEQPIATGDVIGSLVRRRLKDQKYNQYLIEALNRLSVAEDFQNSPILSALRTLEKLFDYRWRNVVADAVYLNDPAIIDHKHAKNSLWASFHEIFGDGVIDWNRIALVCTIVSILAQEALRIGNIGRILRYVTWTEEYFRRKLIDAWIDRKLGWEEIYGFAKQRQKEVGKRYSQPVVASQRASRSSSPSHRTNRTQPSSQAPRQSSRSVSAKSDGKFQPSTSSGYISPASQLINVADQMERSQSPSTPSPNNLVSHISPRVKTPGQQAASSADQCPGLRLPETDGANLVRRNLREEYSKLMAGVNGTNKGQDRKEMLRSALVDELGNSSAVDSLIDQIEQSDNAAGSKP